MCGKIMAYLLMIDDSPQNQRYLERIVRHRTPHTLVCARNGNEGLDKIVERRPDLIFLDLFIPGLDGFEVLKALRAHPATENIPIVIHTAIPFDQITQIRLRRLKYHALLEFPVEASQLNHIIDTALQRSRSPARKWVPPKA
jgi:CheY-like chemotaxis protein